MVRSISIFLVVLLLSGCVSAPVYKCEGTSNFYAIKGDDHDERGNSWMEVERKINITCTPQKDRKNKSPLKTEGKGSWESWADTADMDIDIFMELCIDDSDLDNDNGFTAWKPCERP